MLSTLMLNAIMWRVFMLRSFMLSAFMLSAFTLSALMLSALMLNAIMLSVLASFFLLSTDVARKQSSDKHLHNIPIIVGEDGKIAEVIRFIVLATVLVWVTSGVNFIKLFSA